MNVLLEIVVTIIGIVMNIAIIFFFLPIVFFVMDFTYYKIKSLRKIGDLYQKWFEFWWEKARKYK